MKIQIVTILGLLIFFSSCKKKPVDTKIDFQERMLDKLYPNEGEMIDKNYPFESFGVQAYRNGMRQAQQSTTASRAGEWTVQGPGNIGGRVNTIAIKPDDQQTMMLGYSQGGIFKTQNAGATWNPIFDDELTTSISDIAYDPSNPNIVYAGTGDLNISGNPFTGIGIYKSTDGGETWNHSGLEDAGIISEVTVSSQNSNIVYAASMGVPFDPGSDRGMFKSTDAGETWERVLYINGSTGVIDMEVSPLDDNIIFAASWSRVSAYSQSIVGSGITRILKSEDGGQSWDYLVDGLPDGDLVRPGLAMYPKDDNIVYAMFSKYIEDNDTLECSNGYYIEGLYKTIDRGTTWTEVNTTPESGWRCGFVGGFSWYFGKIRVNPNDPNDVFVLGVDMLRTRNGGVSWNEASPPWWEYSVHADKHDLVFSESEMILATDGGAYRSPILFELWEDLEDIPTTQFYRVGYNPHEPDLYYGGAQDNGTTGGNKNSPNEWDRIFGGDGFTVQFDPNNKNINYVETQRGRVYISDTIYGGYENITGFIPEDETANWDMPYILDESNSSVVICGRQSVWKNDPEEYWSWTKISPLLVDTFFQTVSNSHTISALAQSSLNPNMMFVGTSDGYLWRTIDAGDNWTRVGLPLPERYFSDVRPSPNDETIVYASITGYKDNDFTPYIYKSQDSGQTYEQIQGDLPMVAVNDIFVPANQPEEKTIVVGTDAGVYVTNTSGETWNRLGNNMPIIPVYDLAYNVEKDQLIAGTHARGIWTIPMDELNSVSNKNVDYPLEAKIYPTLTDSYIAVDGKATLYDYSILSLKGETLLIGQCTPDNYIEVGGLVAGYYIINLEAEGKVVSKKFIKS